MSLLDFQVAVGRALRDESAKDALAGLELAPEDRTRLMTLFGSEGFRFTSQIRRSWCVGRASRAARLTLSVLPQPNRERLLDEWVTAGGGTCSFFAAEADSFLDFIARRLPNPSHTLTICRVEQATLRASEGARDFQAPNCSRLDETDCLLHVGQHAGLVHFYGQPHLVLGALEGGDLPPLSAAVTSWVFGPGLPGLFREATPAEEKLWESLVEPIGLALLLQKGHERLAIQELLVAGAAQYYAPLSNHGDSPKRHTSRSVRDTEKLKS